MYAIFCYTVPVKLNLKNVNITYIYAANTKV